MSVLPLRKSRIAWAPVALLLFFSAIAPLALTPDLLASPRLAYFLIPLVIAACIVPIAARWSSGKIDLAYVPLWFVASYILHFGLGPISTVIFGSQFLRIGAEEGRFWPINLALGLALLGILCFWAGFDSRAGVNLQRRFRPLPAFWSRERILPIALGCIGAGYLARLVFIYATAGGVGEWLAQNKDQIMREAEGITYLSAFTNLAPIGLLVLLIAARLTRSVRIWWMFWLLLPGELGFRLISGSRSALAFLVIQTMIAIYMTGERGPRQTRRWGISALSILPLFLVLYPVTTALRVGGLSDPLKLFRESPEFMRPELWAYSISTRFHGVESVALIADKVPRDQPHDLGEHLALVGVAWVPRAVWPEKPGISLGKWFRDEMVPHEMYAEGSAVAITIPGELYMSFGAAGVAVGMLLLGGFMRTLHEHMVVPRRNPSAMFVTAFMLQALLMGLEQEIGFHLTFGIVNYLMCVGVAFLLARTARPPTRAEN